MQARYNHYGRWLKETFGTRVAKVSVDGGFTCPNRDGAVATGGCTYCNNDSFRPEGVTPKLSVEAQIQRGIAFLSRRFRADQFLVYWQNYTNTYAPVEHLRSLFSSSLAADPRIVGMAIGTRPDCVEEEKLNMIKEVAGGRYVCMEYGLESIYDETLKRINRGHDFAAYVDAVKRTKSHGFAICSHLIFGFPYETREQMMTYADAVNRLGVDFVKIHHLHIVKHTPLAREYLFKPFAVFEYEEWIQFVTDFLERLDPEIVIQRLYGWAPEEHLIAPKWNRTKAEIILDVERELERRDSRQGKRFTVPSVAF